MATFTFGSIADRFPPGTAVGAYLIRQRPPVTGAEQPPFGSPIVAATVTDEGTLTFTDLLDDTKYTAYAAVSGVPTYRNFSTVAFTGSGPSGGNGPPGPPGPQGPSGPSGPAGPAGSDAVAASDAVRGAPDRFYKLVAGAARYNGSGWDLVNDASSRPQNIDSISSDSHKISLGYGTISALHVASFSAVANEDLVQVGIRPIVKPTVTGVDVTLRQDRRFTDFASWDGTKWVLAKGGGSPYTLTGLNGTSSDYSATVLATANLVAYYRFTDASGAVLTDAGPGTHNGVVVSTGATYGVAGGVVTDAGDKAITVATGGTNEFTFALMGFMTQAAFSVEWFGKLPTNATVVFRDAPTVSNQGYYIAKDGSTPAKVYYRLGASTFYTTTMLWSALADNNWHHVVLTKNGANASLYVDGVLVHSTTSGSSVALATPWHVGRSGQNGSAVASEAVTMSEMAFYSAELTAAQVTAHNYAAIATGVLHVAHEEAGSTSPGGIILTPQGSGARPVIGDAVTGTGFDVKFYDSANALMLGATTGMKVGITRDVAERTINPVSFTARVNVSGDDYDATVVADGPIGYWPLGDTVGAVTVAPTVGAASGTVASGVTLGVAGLLAADPRTAAQFDGVQGKISFANPNLVNTPFTLEVWFKCTGAGTVGGTTFSAIMGWSNAGTTRRILLNNVDASFLISAGGANLTTAAGAAPLNAVHHMVFVWDLLTQSLYLNGVLVASNATASVGMTLAWYLGSYLATSTNYSFKGVMGRAALYQKALTANQVQQHYATGAGIVLVVDRAVGSQLTFQGVFETGAPAIPPPPDQALPTATPLAANDLGGEVTANLPLEPYRSTISLSTGWLKRALPATVGARNAVLLNGWTVGANSYPAATSENWRQSLCDIIGIDKNTSQAQAVPNLVPSIIGAPTPMWLRPGEWIYVVPDDQPLRPYIDQDVSVAGWATEINDIAVKLGGFPMPADARPHGTPDRYAFFYQPSKDRSVTIYDFHGSVPATTTLQLTGSPSSGAFGLKFLYRDNALITTQTYFSQTMVPYNATAAQVKTVIDGAKTTAGSLFGASGTRPGSYYGSCIVTGGPLNVAPITVSFPSVDPLQPVAFILTDFFLNSGTVQFTYQNAGPYDRGRLSSIITPSLDAVIATGVSGFAGAPYTNRFDGAGFRYMDSRWGPTATGIDMFEMVPSWEEYQTALTNGTSLGHVIPMSIGNCQGAPFSAVFPATRGDGTLTRADGSMICEGARIAFPPDVDLSGVIPEFLPIARTIRDYGVIPIDKTGGGTEIILRRNSYVDSAIPNVWVDMLPLYRSAGDAPLRYMRSLPWHKAQIIDPSFSM